MIQKVLAVETSCDDTSVAVVAQDGSVLALISANQNQVHQVFGGVVPEIASRNHTHHLLPLIEKCLAQAQLSLQDIDGFAVTSAPGLIGSLLVGLVSVKTLALVTGKPFLGVNHLEGHLLAPFLRDSQYAPPSDFSYPYLGLAISGGHTSLYRIEGLGEYKVLGHTIDDAAGEAFDKFAKMIGLGFPGGVFVDQVATLGGNPQAFQFPRALVKDQTNFNFSFSGLKTAAQRAIESLPTEKREQLRSDLQKWRVLPTDTSLGSSLLADFCASYQEAIVEVLLTRLDQAVQKTGLARAVLTGGVSANSRLRSQASVWAQSAGVQLVIPPLRYCTDNAAMIGLAGILRLNRGERSAQDLGPSPKSPLGLT
jgi:N6-L-threonylcarbamoyladenine synthase